MIIYVDIDNTICATEGDDYEGALPIQENIDKINKLYDEEHTIVYWTGRGSGSGIDWRNLTLAQLIHWGCKHHELKMGKPVYDLFIEDRSKRIEEI